jgi:hypothetical protein
VLFRSVGSVVLTVMSGCDMDLLGVGDCPEMCCNVKTQRAEATLCQQSRVTHYMQMKMHTTVAAV